MMKQGIVGMPTSSIMTGLLTQRKAREFRKNTSQLFLRPTEEGKFYQLRLLNIEPDQKFVASSNFSNYRDFPFIIQHIHQVWTEIPTDDPNKPKRVPHTIVCPQTDYVKANSSLSKNQCPMCAAYGSAWKAYSDSKYKNVQAKEKMKTLHNSLRVLVPVYVVVDPNYEANNGAVKVLALDEDSYKMLLAQINAAQGNNTPIWNQGACNLFFSWGKYDKTVNEGKQNAYTFQKTGFTRVGFTTTPKNIDGLTDDIVDDLQFDANWYQVPTKEELEQFYMDYCSSQASANADIPMDIPPVVAAPAPAPKKPAPAAPAPVEDPVAKDVVVDSDNIPAPAAEPPKAVKKAAAPAPAPAADDVNSRIDDILAGLSL